MEIGLPPPVSTDLNRPPPISTHLNRPPPTSTDLQRSPPISTGLHQPPPLPPQTCVRVGTNDGTADTDEFVDLNFCGGAFIMLGLLFAVATLVIVCVQLACMDHTTCLAKALNLTFSSVSAFCLFCGVVLASVLYVEAADYYSKRDRDPSDASDYTIMVASYCEPTSDDGEIGAYVNWTYGMAWLALLFQITVVILLGVLACCCSRDRGSRGGRSRRKR
ncbi:uncharacterized protein LOC142352517 [Convolutriloba macropyga]|uniref:uncharacterized protein LOC142352517 n=1 Tax=Convolutriloba macropyga TaxID=536237 RepID=UPI003F527B3F